MVEDINEPTPTDDNHPLRKSLSRLGIWIASFVLLILRKLFSRLGIWIALFALLSLLVFGLRRSQSGPVAVGSRVPEFTLTTFDGEQIHTKDLTGKILVINFWASWCKPCELEAADLQSAWERYESTDQVVFLGIDYVDTEPEARAYLERFKITYPNGPDLGTRISQTFRIRGVPETYIVDRKGIITSVKIGPFSSMKEITSIIDSLTD